MLEALEEAVVARNIVGESKRDKDVQLKGCISVKDLLTKAEVYAQEYIEQIKKRFL